MVAELRRNGKQLVLYTDNKVLYNYIDSHSAPRYKIPYLQKGKVIGIDLYFDRGLRYTVKHLKSGQMVLGI